MMRTSSHHRTDLYGPGTEVAEHYVIEDRVASGAMGDVYRATDKRLDRLVALKFIRPESRNDVYIDRFEAEARTLSRIVHPNVVAIYDFGQFAGAPFIAMELVDGGSLLDVVLRKRTALSVEEVVDLASQVAQALAEAHGHDIIHRDIKPANILLRTTATGRLVAKVVDFGLARRRRGEGERDAFVEGTPAYMSPEQARGESLDGRSDLYALAIVVYQLLTSEMPFEGGGSPVDIARRRLDHRPRPIGETTAGAKLPREVQHEVMRALERRRDDRQDSVTAFAEALRVAVGLDGEDAARRTSCPSCGDDKARAGGFCGRCGAAVPHTFCRECGTRRVGERYHCGSCGSSLLPARKAMVRGGLEANAGVRLDRGTAAFAVLRSSTSDWPAAARSGLAYDVLSVVEREGGQLQAVVGDEWLMSFGVGGMRGREVASAVNTLQLLIELLEERAAALDPAPGAIVPRTADARGAVTLGDVETVGAGFAWGAAFLGGATLERARAGVALAEAGEILLDERAAREARRELDLQPHDTGWRRYAGRHEAGASAFAELVLPFVGRTAQLATLRRAARDVLSSRSGRVVTVRGGAETGKSRLLDVFLAQAGREGWEVLRTSCSAHRLDGPHLPMLDLLRQRLGFTDLARARVLIEGLLSRHDPDASADARDRRGNALMRLLGVLEPGAAKATLTPVTRDAQQAAYHAYVACLDTACADRPTVLVVDDLQWARHGTLELLRYVLAGRADRPQLTILALRDDQAERCLEGLRLPVHRVHNTALLPLTATDLQALLGGLAGGVGPREVADALHEATGGMPGHVADALHMWSDAGVLVRKGERWLLKPERARQALGSASLDELMLQRVGRLPPSERELLKAMAASGHPAPLELLGAMLDREVDRSELHALVAAGHVSSYVGGELGSDETFHLRHGAVARALAASLPVETVRALHARAVRWLLEHASGAPQGLGVILAHHLQAAGDRVSAASRLLDVARDALGALANRAALEACEAAAVAAREEIDDGGDLRARALLVDALIGLAEVANGIGESARALSAAEEAHDVLMAAAFDSSTPPIEDGQALELRAAIARGDALHHAGRYDDAVATLTEAAKLADRLGDPASALYTQALVAMVHTRRHDDAAAERIARAALQRGARGGDARALGATGRLWTLLGHIDARRAGYDSARKAYRKAARVFDDADDRIASVLVELSLGTLLYREGRYDDAEAQLRETAERCDEIDHLRGAAIARTNIANVLLDRGDLHAALDAIEDAETRIRAIGATDYLIETRRLRAIALAQLGDPRGAGAALDEAIAMARAYGQDAVVPALEATRGELTGTPEEVAAETVASRHQDPEERPPTVHPDRTTRMHASGIFFDSIGLPPQPVDGDAAADASAEPAATNLKATRAILKHADALIDAEADGGQPDTSTDASPDAAADVARDLEPRG